MTNQDKFLDKYGPWALVTGASSGIGAEYVRQLAEKGLNIVLIARRKHRMEELSEEVKSKFHIQTKIIDLDLLSANFYEELKPQIANLELGLIVNNAGMGRVGHFYICSYETQHNIFRLNAEVPFILTHHLAKRLLDRGKGGIIFTSSIGGLQVTPYMSNYGATKAYILSLAESLSFEFAKKGVDVLALCPGMTKTEMTESVHNLKLMEVGPVVRKALKNLGRKTIVVPGFKNKMIGIYMQRILGKKIVRNLMGNIMYRVLPGAKD